VEVPVPETVQALIAARLDTLPSEHKALLQDAAVVGQVFWSGALASMGGIDERHVRAGLHELARYELLRLARRSSIEHQAEYAFWHGLIRDVAYNQLPRAARADRHHRAAEWLKALTPDRAEDRVELLAHHRQAAFAFADAAGQDTVTLAERARLALREAGDRAFSLNSFAAAARWYTAALELWPAGHPQRPQLLLRLGETRLYAESAAASCWSRPATRCWPPATRRPPPWPRRGSAPWRRGRGATSRSSITLAGPWHWWSEPGRRAPRRWCSPTWPTPSCSVKTPPRRSGSGARRSPSPTASG
jgi:predicted ATPase